MVVRPGWLAHAEMPAPTLPATCRVLEPQHDHGTGWSCCGTLRAPTSLTPVLWPQWLDGVGEENRVARVSGTRRWTFVSAAVPKKLPATPPRSHVGTVKGEVARYRPHAEQWLLGSVSRYMCPRVLVWASKIVRE